MESEKKLKFTPWLLLKQVLYLLPLILIVHYLKLLCMNQVNFFHRSVTDLDLIDISESQCKYLMYEAVLLRKEINDLKAQLAEIQSWKVDLTEKTATQIEKALDAFYSDQLGMFDYASEYAGSSILSTPDTTPYPSNAKLQLHMFGAIDWFLKSEPAILLQHSNYPGQCFAFYGNKGRIRIKLGQPIVITHITLEHMQMPEIQSAAPKDFAVLGLGDADFSQNFTYELDGRALQTFKISPSNKTISYVELRILSNHGNPEFTCVYRFRVHSLVMT